MQHKFGLVREGKLAELIVLSRSLFVIPAEELLKVTIAATSAQ